MSQKKPDNSLLHDQASANESIIKELEKAKPFLDMTDIIHIALDKKGKVIFANRKACEILEYQYDEIIGKEWFSNFLPASRRDEIYQVFQALIKEEIDLLKFYENPIVTKNGKEKNIAWHNAPIRNHTNSIIGILSSGEDISSKGHIAISLEASEDWFRTIFYESPVAINVFDAEGNLIDANKAILDLAGVSHKTDLMKFNLFEDPNFSDEMKSEIRSGETIHYRSSIDFNTVIESNQYPTKKTGIIHVESAISPIMLNSEVQGYVVQLLDITDRKVAEDEVLVTKEKIEVIFNNINAGVVLVNAETRKIEDANPEALRLLEMKKDEIVGTLCHDSLCLVPPDHCPVLGLNQNIDNEEHICKSKSGKEIPILKTVNKVKINGIDYLLESFIDITKQKKIEQDLRASEIRFREIITVLPEGIGISTENQELTFVNPTFCEILGYEKNELIGMNLSDLVVPGEWEKILEQSEKREKGEITSYEVSLIRKDSKIITTRVSAVPYYDERRTFAGTLAVVTDITEQKRTEKALKQREAQYRELISLLPTGVVIGDLDENIILVNEGMAKILDIPKEKLVDNNLLDFIHKEDRKKIVSQTSKRKEGETSSYDIRIIRKDGEERIVAVHAAPKRNINGEVDGSVGIFIDVTEQKLMEETLKRERATLKAITDSTADAIIMIDGEGKIIFWNPAAEEMFGYSQDEIFGQPVHTTIIPPEGREAFKYGMKAFSDPEQTPTMATHREFPGMRKDGTIIPTEISTAPLMIGKRRGAVTNIRDITERVKIQKLKEEQHRELELYASLLRHDLRNDLGVILGNVDIARMITSEEDQEMRELIASTEAVCDRMMKLLHALGRRAEHVEKNLVELVKKTAIQAQEAEDNLTIEMDVSEEVECVEVPSSRLLPMVFENLFRNAAIHAGEEPTVNVTISRINENVEILVSDNGPGVDESIRNNLFQKGVSTRGGGLGLYLSKEIVSAIGGKIELVDSESGQGACFRVVLPQSN